MAPRRPPPRRLLLLTRRKAQVFKSKLVDELRTWATEKHVTIPDERDVIPFVQEAVFLHHPQFRSELTDQQSINLYGLDGAEATSNLDPISDLILDPPAARPSPATTNSSSPR